MKTTIGSRQGLGTVLYTGEVYNFNAAFGMHALALTNVRVPVEFFHTLLHFKISADTIRFDAFHGNSSLYPLRLSNSVFSRLMQSIRSSNIDIINYLHKCLNYWGNNFFVYPVSALKGV